MLCMISNLAKKLLDSGREIVCYLQSGVRRASSELVTRRFPVQLWPVTSGEYD